jgi:hypothetical protein
MVTKIPEATWTVPDELKVPPDTLRARIDFFHQSIRLTVIGQDISKVKMVSAADIARILAENLSFGSGLIPEGTLWYCNTHSGPLYALYEKPRVWPAVLATGIDEEARHYKLPMPGLIFLCSPGIAPWVFAVKRKPLKETDEVFHAPLSNIHQNGRSCGGTHQYPGSVSKIPASFFEAFFTSSASVRDRSIRHPGNILGLWDEIDGLKKYPMEDLVHFGTIKDLLNMEMR